MSEQDLQDVIGRNIRLWRLFHPGETILVAVSGGVDSMVLLHLLHALARENRWRLIVAHLNHKLRGRSSDADERLVQQGAKKLGLSAIVERQDVRAFARANKLSIEMAARKLRHDFLAQCALKQRAGCVALAHHADDQIELFFLRLFRGSSGEGLAGMKWTSPSPSDSRVRLVRPLLDQLKSALRAYAAEKGIAFREDATNALADFQRNRIRHELLPRLRKRHQPAIDRIVLRLMDILGEEAEFVARAAGKWLAQKRRAGFGTLAVAVQRQCIRLQLSRHGVMADFELVEHLRLNPGKPVAIPCLAADTATVTREPSGFVRVESVSRPNFKTDEIAVELKGGGGEIQFEKLKVSWKIVRVRPIDRKQPKRRERTEVFDADVVGPQVALRHWRPGDRFQPIGMDCAVKLQDFFVNEKVPRWSRHQLVVAETASGEVFWVEGMRISECFKLTPKTSSGLQWRWKTA